MGVRKQTSQCEEGHYINQRRPSVDWAVERLGGGGSVDVIQCLITEKDWNLFLK